VLLLVHVPGSNPNQREKKDFKAASPQRFEVIDPLRCCCYFTFA
jgi:hypothetical protein